MEENDKKYVQQRLKTMLQEDKQSALVMPTSPGTISTEFEDYDQEVEQDLNQHPAVQKILREQFENSSSGFSQL